MSMSHYSALLIAYSAALLAALGVMRQVPHLWPVRARHAFDQPWREVAWALAATAGVIGIGMLYSHGWLLPATSQRRPLLDVLNQLLIYAPFPLLLVLRHHGPETAWLPKQSILLRIGLGGGLALLALLIYAIARLGPATWPRLVAQVYAPEHVSYFVQVLLEDISIAVLVVRFRAVLGVRWTLLLVAVLFAAGHIPGLLASGAQPTALRHLLGDVGLGVLVLALLQRMQDVWCFWMVHFALDMTQFYTVGAAT